MRKSHPVMNAPAEPISRSADGPAFIGRSGAPGGAQIDHPPVARSTWSRKLITRDRRDDNPCDQEAAQWFLTRAYVVAFPLRRGYGATGGKWAESYGSLRTFLA